MQVKNCRLCQKPLSQVLSLGNLPIVNYFPSEEEQLKIKKYPLDFCVCQNCGLAQLSYLISPEKLFIDQHYTSGASAPLINHLGELTDFCIKEFGINKNSKVFDIGANDGTLLSQFQNRGIEALGIDPSVNAAKLAQAKNLTIINDFFNSKKSRQLQKEQGKFDLITTTHTLANIVDLHDFIGGIKSLLAKKGVLVIEVGSLSLMLARTQFDAIYHEHFSYFSFSPLQKLLSMHGLEIFKAETNSFHGGSLRIFATHKGKSITKLQFMESIKAGDFRNFRSSVTNFKKNLNSVFDSLDVPMVGFGAPAKSVTLLNFCQPKPGKIPFIVDSTSYKQGRFLPGLNIPIYPENYVKGKNIDSYLLLAWNYKEEILKKIRSYTNTARVIVPFPKLEIVTL